MIFDTDVLIWALRGNNKAAEKIAKTAQRACSGISYMELMKGARNKTELRLIKQFLNDLEFQIIPVDVEISHRATVYIEEYTLQNGLDIADALIAATATKLGRSICTANDRHYKTIPGLDIKRFRP